MMKRITTIVLTIFLAVTAFAQQKNVFDIARSGTLKEIEQLYKSNPELINSLNERKSSPLILACYKGNEAVAFFLADKVKDVNYNSGMGTALMAAVMSGNENIVKKLIAKKVELNQADTQGKTALIYAVFFNKNEIAKQLITAGANKSQKDNDGKSALDYAKLNKNTELTILLDN